MAQRSPRSARSAPDPIEPLPIIAPVPEPTPPAPLHPIYPRKRGNQAPGAQRRQGNREPASTLWYGDNLEILRDHVRDESVDLVYLDPPFNSNRAYNVIFRGPEGVGASSQIQAFEDTWTWRDSTNAALADIMRKAPVRVQQVVDALVHALERNDVTAYLVMMTQRLVELHRVMKPTGSLYLHCDPTASHYLKIVLDALFGPTNFRNEVIWKRTSAHSSARRFGPVHDVILFYTKSDNYTWNPAYQPLPRETTDQWYNNVEDGTGRRYNRADLTAPGVRKGSSGLPWRGVDPTDKGRHWAIPRAVSELVDGLDTLDAVDALDAAGRIHWPKRESGAPMLKRYLNESKGIPAQDVIGDIYVNNVSAERVGYPTQKPLALLKRFIEASSNAGDVVLDPFCGCGTAVVAAEKLGRRWIGIDVTSLAIGVIEKRMDDLFQAADFAVKGLPESKEDAEDLARRDPFQFQWWAAGRVMAEPRDGRNRKGPDQGVDGIIPFQDDPTGRRKSCIVSVKSGRNVGAEDVRALLGTVEASRAQAGLLITLQEPTAPMKAAAAKAGYYESALGHAFPKIQILTVGDLLADKLPDLPVQEGQLRRRRRIDALKAVQQPLPAW